MRKSGGNVDLTWHEWMRHLRAGNGNGSKNGAMKREYWQEYRAKAKAAGRNELDEFYERGPYDDEGDKGDCPLCHPI